MANVLNQIIANKPINPSMQAKPAYTIDTTGKVKPLEDKAKLLPSRIFGSPIEYAKDLKQDVLNIGKAVKGKANDHELGRINDLGMKIGAGALAAYLFTKSPFKLSKAMEIVGAGSFFAAMALWPKLAIQAPIKARTGVDIHQKYIDSQGRKKMLHQDPQYDLTDLYSRKDLDKMGKKLKVDENLPDRDRFIKQRAKKTAVQGNTLWMMTAGLATPLGSALMCNALEKPVSTGIEKANLFLTKGLSDDALVKGAAKFATSKADGLFISKFCRDHAGEALSEDMIDVLATRMTKGLPESIKVALKQQIGNLAEAKVDNSSIVSILENCNIDASKAKNIVSQMSPADIKGYIAELAEGSDFCPEMLKLVVDNGGETSKLGAALESIRGSKTSVGQLQDKLTSLSDIMGKAKAENGIIAKFIKERVGKIQNSHNANQWGRTTKSFIKALGFSDKELTAIAKGQDEAIRQKLVELGVDNAEIKTLLKGKTSAIADKFSALGVDSSEIKKLLSIDPELLENKLTTLANSSKYRAFEEKFLGGIDKYNSVTGKGFISTIKAKTKKLFEDISKNLSDGGFGIASKAFDNETAKTLSTLKASESATGARSSFYRMFQAVDIRKGTFLRDSLLASKIPADRVDELVDICKKVSLDATLPDIVQKLQTKGYELSPEEYKAVAKALYGKANGTVNKGYTDYLKEFVGKVVNFDEGIVLDHKRCKLGETVASTSPERQALVGENISNAIRDTAKNMVNSRKWLKIMGGTFAVLTVATVIATLFLGKKGKTEKQVEEKQGTNKVNG